MRKLSTYVVAAAVLVALALCPVAARADSSTFDLTVPEFLNSQGQQIAAPGPGPYVQVTVDLTSPTTALITYTSLTDSKGYTYWMGDGFTIALNVNATNFTTNASAAGDAGFLDYGGVPAKGPGTSSTFDHLPGMFNFWIDNKIDKNGGVSGYVNMLSFTITDTSGTWGKAGDVLIPDPQNAPYDIGAHLDACLNDPSGTACVPVQQGINGYAAGLAPVPEPPVNVLLLCSALLFGGCFLRRPLWS